MSRVHPGVTALAATLATIAGGVGLVWLADDVRAFGLAVVVAGTVASAIALRLEQPHGPAPANRASVNTPPALPSVSHSPGADLDKVA